MSRRADAGAGLRPLRPHLATLVCGVAFVLLGAAYLAGAIPRQPLAVAGVASVLTLAGSALRGLLALRRRLLWRIRRKLVLSYLFIALVPLLLVTTVLTVLAYTATGQLLAYLASRSLESLEREVDGTCLALTESLAGLAESSADFAAMRRVTDSSLDLEKRRAAIQTRYAGAQAVAVVASQDRALRHTPAGLAEWPAGVMADKPGWLNPEGRFPAGLVLQPQGDLEVRAAAGRKAGPYDVYVEVSVPVDEDTLNRLKPVLGADLRIVERVPGDDRPRRHASTSLGERERRLPVFGVMYLSPRRWADGNLAETSWLLVAERSVGELLLEVVGFGAENRVLLRSLAVVMAAAFVLIEGASLWAGVKLAKSITGSIHAISLGVERVERGDRVQRFPVQSDDQLGDLGRTLFDRVAAAVERQAERERLEEELRIGRRIQQSLLPPGDWRDDRFEIAAVSLPARQVGGDYYDFFDLGGGRLALLAADVSGKGTEAAFYMAEVKGIMLALARHDQRPVDVLDDANRLLSLSLDRRTFVTMTYAVLDRGTGDLCFGRAGHSPVLYLPAQSDRVESIRPSGLALGIERKGGFRRCLEERSLRLAPGDLVLLYTDGVTDTLSASEELYGDSRLAEAFLAGRSRTAEGLRDHLLADLRRFAASGPLHDDLTVIVLRAL